MIIIINLGAMRLETKNYSRKREAILAKIHSTHSHPTADCIYDSLKKEYPDLSLATVYRNLKLFKEEGLITSLVGNTNQELFDGNLHPHGHFICRSCNAVIDIPSLGCESENITAPTEIEGSKIERVAISFYGVCKNCSSPA